MAVTTDRLPGDDARRPTQIPPRGWWQVTRRALKESGDDSVPMLAGRVAFFAFLAVVPALIAAASLYGWWRTGHGHPPGPGPRRHLPRAAQPLIAGQLTSLVSGSSNALGIGLVVSLQAELWSASSGTGNLMKAVNLADDETETLRAFA